MPTPEVPNGFVVLKIGDMVPPRSEYIFRYPGCPHKWSKFKTDRKGFKVGSQYGVDDNFVIAFKPKQTKREW